jgi:hypothetical protein
MSTFVRDTGDSTPSSEAPIAWRVWWKPENGRPFDREFQAAARHKDFQTRTEAEVEKRRIDERLAGQGAVHIAPIYISRAKRERRQTAQQNSLTSAGWPIQMRPPRPGAPEKGMRRGRS